MRISRTNHAEFVRIGAEFFFQIQSSLQRLPCILSCQHAVLFEFAHVEVRLIPGFVVGELIVGG